MPLSSALSIAAYGLLAWMIGRVGWNALRHPNRADFDIFACAATLALYSVAVRLRSLIGSTGDVPISLLFLAQPYFVVRLVQHFRLVPRWRRLTVWSGMAAGALIVVAWPEPRPFSLAPAALVYFIVFQLYAGLEFLAESRRATGSTGWRLRLTGAGFLTLAAAQFASSADHLMHSSGADMLGGLLDFSTYLLLYLGLAPPIALRRVWQRGVLYRFLRQASGRELDLRERHAAASLREAVEHSLPVAAAVVLFGREELVVHAATSASWQGLTVRPGKGLIGEALTLRQPTVGRTRHCESGLVRQVVAAGRWMLAMPIYAHGTCWGALLVVQRYGALFLKDEIDLLDQLCRYTADTLTHARLLADERERERRAAEARVEATESQLDTMLESIRDFALVTLNETGRVTSWSLGAEQVFGYPARAMLGRPAAALFDDETFALDAALGAARTGGRVVQEGRCRRSDGGTFTGSTIIRPLRRGEVAANGFVMVTRDVTEQRHLEERLRQGQKMEAIGRLAGGVAHDFNNQLTAIMGFADMLDLTLPAGASERAEVAQIRKAAERSAQLTRQLLTFSRRQVLQPQVLSLTAVVHGLLPMLQRLLGEPIEVRDDCDPDARPILADPGQAEQVVINLAVNARDAMEAKGGRLRICVAHARLDRPIGGDGLDAPPGPYTMLEVADTGTGMDAQTRARMFEPFFTTKAFGRGTGLGLATVYGIVKQLGGGIAVDSSVGHGSTFRVYFPQASADTLVERPAQTEAPAGGSERVLLVEDEAPVRLFISSLLVRHGYDVLVAESPAAALALAAAHPHRIDLVVTDVVMPGGTGPDLARSLTAIRPGLRTLFISGYADDALHEPAAGRTDGQLLQKPFTAPQLLAKVRQALL